MRKLPFSFEIKEITENIDSLYEVVGVDSKTKEPKLEFTGHTIQFRVDKKDNLYDIIHKEIISRFDFTKYMNNESEDYIGKPNNLKYLFKIEIYDKKNHVQDFYIECVDFNTEYSYKLITTPEKLLEILSKEQLAIATDLETSGLNPEFDTIAGVSLAFGDDLYTGYYIPFNHVPLYASMNLPIEYLGNIVERLKQTPHVFLHNSRFDIRFIERRGYGFSDVMIYDTMFLARYRDPERSTVGLKQLERDYLDIIRPDLEDTIKGLKLDNFDFRELDPRHAVFYAGQDALSALILGLDCFKDYQEFGISSQLDRELIYPLMKAEDQEILVDLDYLKESLDNMNKRLDEINKKLQSLVGDINWNSPKQKIELFESFKLDTGKRTDKGAMKTGTQEINDMIDRMRLEGKPIPEFLLYIEERNVLDKLTGTFFQSLYDQAKERNGKVRLNYRLANTSTGRLSSGEELR